VKANIVIIDDEVQIRRMLRIALASEGYAVTEAENALRGLSAVARQQPDLVILDLGLPDMDGQKLLLELRDWSNVPVIVLSARGLFQEKVRALDAGARDYITKPFSVEELLARVRAHLRDTVKPEEPTVMDDGYLMIDAGKRMVTVAGKHAGLTPKEFAVLLALAKAPNCVITQSQLLQTIWGPTHEQDTHYLRIVISHLRQKLGDDPTEPKYIRTESGVGYRLVWSAGGTLAPEG
jgi:two-component system KDP operon response regulator KdpE